MPQGHGQLRRGSHLGRQRGKTHPPERLLLLRNAEGGNPSQVKTFRALALHHAAPLFGSGGAHAEGQHLRSGFPEGGVSSNLIRADAPGAGTPGFPQNVPTSHGRHRAARRQAQDIPPSKNVDALPPKIREERVVSRKRRRIVRLRRVSLSGPTSFSACRPGVPEPPQAYPSSWQSAGGCTGFPAP